MEEVQQSVVRAGGAIWSTAVVPLSLLVLLSDWATWWRSPWLLGEGVMALVLGLALFVPGLRSALRHRAIVAAQALLATFALFHFGPLLGTGLLFVLPLVFAVMLLDWREAIGTWWALVTAVALAGLGDSLGVVTPQISLEAADWLRITGTTAVALGACLFVFGRVHVAFVDSLVARDAARLQEQAAFAERGRVLEGAAAAQRMESLGRLAGGVAHEFNNALVVVRAGVDHLRSVEDRAQRDQVFTEIELGLHRASTTARHLLMFSRRDVVEAAWSEPTVVLHEVAGALGRLFPERVRVEVHATDVPRIAMGRQTLEQALLTLALSARDRLGAAGTVRLRCAPGEAGVVVSIEDDGPVLGTEEQERLFEPFVSSRAVAEDGLGMALVWATITRAGGRVTVGSVDGSGTVISLHLPAAEPELAPAPVALESGLARAGGRVLLLEDEEIVRTVVTRILTRAQYAVDAFPSVESALGALATGDYDVLVTDGVVPDAPVSTLIAAYRARFPAGPVLVVSGYVEEDLVMNGIERGAYRFLQKPFDPQELVGVVTRLLQQAGT